MVTLWNPKRDKNLEPVSRTSVRQPSQPEAVTVTDGTVPFRIAISTIRFTRQNLQEEPAASRATHLNHAAVGGLELTELRFFYASSLTMCRYLASSLHTTLHPTRVEGWLSHLCQQPPPLSGSGRHLTNSQEKHSI